MIKATNKLTGKTNASIIKVYPELENIEITPTVEDQTYTPTKYGFEEVKVKGDSDLVPENIKEGVTIFNIEGNFSPLDTSDATATEEDILLGKTAYVNGEKINGTLEAVDTRDADATNNDLLLGKTAYVNNQKVTGVMEVNDNNALVKTPISEGNPTRSGLSISIIKIPDDLIVSGTSMNYMFSYCSGLTEINIDTSGVETAIRAFASCGNLTKLSQLEASKFNRTQNMFYLCSKLQEFGGLLNLGKGFDQKESSSAYHTLSLDFSTKLTHESLMNIINNLYDLNLTYDVANGGTLYNQQLQLGSTNLAKLTDEEKAIATSKGWSLA